MRVDRIAVGKLFRVFDYQIPLSRTERVTIIHGANGVGKTTLLKMIEALANGHLSIFRHTPFEEFKVTFDDGTARSVTRHDDRQEGGAADIDRSGRHSQPRVEFWSINQKGKRSQRPVALEPELSPSMLYHIAQFVSSTLQPIGPEGLWRDVESGEMCSLAELLERFPEARSALPPRLRAALREPSEDWKVFFVTANRLEPDRSQGAGPLRPTEGAYYQEPPRSRSASLPRVEQFSRDLVRQIRAVLADYAKHSQELDRTSPERLVRFMRDGREALPAAQIVDRMTELEKKRVRLIRLGFLDRESGLGELPANEVERAPQALTIYVDDVEAKLRVFDKMADRIGALTDIVNDRFRYKQLRIDREQGFRVLAPSGDVIALGDLSSGEQHELVVLYDLLFRAESGSLVLIDEPELSLHVAWQSRFLADLIKILELTEAYALVATHSPVSIEPRKDLAVELTGPATGA